MSTEPDTPGARVVGDILDRFLLPEALTKHPRTWDESVGFLIQKGFGLADVSREDIAAALEARGLVRDGDFGNVLISKRAVDRVMVAALKARGIPARREVGGVLGRSGRLKVEEWDGEHWAAALGVAA